jgi:hypothetical protein
MRVGLHSVTVYSRFGSWSRTRNLQESGISGGCYIDDSDSNMRTHYNMLEVSHMQCCCCRGVEALLSGMSSFDVSLGSPAFNDGGVDNIHEDFRFLVGEQRCSCPRVIARLLSRKLSVHYSIDASINDYIIEMDDLQNEFPLILSLGRGSMIHVTIDNDRFLFSLSRE